MLRVRADAPGMLPKGNWFAKTQQEPDSAGASWSGDPVRR